LQNTYNYNNDYDEKEDYYRLVRDQRQKGTLEVNNLL